MVVWKISWEPRTYNTIPGFFFLWRQLIQSRKLSKSRWSIANMRNRNLSDEEFLKKIFMKKSFAVSRQNAVISSVSNYASWFRWPKFRVFWKYFFHFQFRTIVFDQRKCDIDTCWYLRASVFRTCWYQEKSGILQIYRQLMDNIESQSTASRMAWPWTSTGHAMGSTCYYDVIAFVFVAKRRDYDVMDVRVCC